MLAKLLRTSVLVLLPCVALFFAACGSDDSGGGGTAGSGAAVPTGGGGTGPGGTGPGGTGPGGTGPGGTGPGGTGGTGGEGGACVDSCPFTGGVQWECRDRFMYGVNYAWSVFAGDFGGVTPWGQPGVVADEATHAANLAAMRAAGASTIRWWMFPRFWGDGVTFDNNDVPTGVSAGAIADLQKALELADQADVYLMLCLFSFDNFYPSATVQGIWTPAISNMIRDSAQRQALMDHVVAPLAQAVEASPYRRRMVAWDVINEPEWAMSGSNPYGDPAYDTNGQLDAVTHAQMETFVSDAITTLHGNSGALVTVGGAAVKWSQAWTHVDVDFYQFHIYDWVDTWWPYQTPASTYGLTKPMVMGEMPMDQLNGTPYGTVVQSFYGNGYAGAMSWMFNGAAQQDLANIKAFADLHPCETTYSPYPAQSFPLAAPHPRARPASGLLPSIRLCTMVDGRPVCRRVP